MSKAPILVIGASRGIGKRTAELLIADGHQVVSISRGNESVEGLAHHFTCDITQAELPDLSDLNELGGLVYCPGSIDLKPVRGISLDAMREAFELNVVGAFKSIKQYAPLLKKQPGSGIVLFSTVAVQRGMPFHASVAAAKGAVEGLCKSMAAEFAPNIRVNCIAPSLTRTDLAEKLLNTEAKEKGAAERHPLKRVGEVDDVASMAAFLVSDKANWITGQIIGVDGGLSAI